VTVGCGRDDRTAPTSTLTIVGSGVLDLMNHSITFASLVMDGGTITTRDRGELDLAGDVTVAAGSSSTIAGVVSLGQATRNVTIGTGGVLTISAAVDGGGGLVLRGTGRLVLPDGETVTGSTSITGGTPTVISFADGHVVVNRPAASPPGGTTTPTLTVPSNPVASPQAGTTTSMLVTPGSIRAGRGHGHRAHGRTVTLSALVVSQTPGAGSPTGMVTFFDGTVALGTAPLIDGRATLTTGALAPGDHVLRAVYSGDAGFEPSTSAVATDRNGTVDQRFIDRTFQAVFGRPAEPAGLAFWVRKLHRGISRARIVSAMERSLEVQVRRSTRGQADSPRALPWSIM
jgi:hypothetical protein